ncbi:MAG: hypothetical protein Fur002_24650 [Anaerolineales bacterium]
MKWLSNSLVIARLRGVEIRLHISLLLSLPIAYYLFQPATLQDGSFSLLWLLGFNASILFHELGHAAVASWLGAEVKSVVIWLLGGFTSLARKDSHPKQMIAIAAAGPLTNMALAFVFVAAYIALQLSLTPVANTLDALMLYQALGRLFFSLALVNLILAALNLLPIYPLDGGTIFHAWLEWIFGKARANFIALLVGIPILLALLGFALYAKDYLLAFSCVLIALALGTLNNGWRMKLNLAVNYLLKRSGYYLMQGDYDKAIASYTREIDKEPQQANHYIGRATVWLMLAQSERAKADAERALRLAPNHPLALELRGEIHLLEKNFAEAESFFARAEQAAPQWALPHFDYSSLLLDKGEYAAALERINKAMQMQPRQYFFHLQRAQIYFKLGDVNSAHQDEEVAVSLAEKDALVMNEVNLAIYENALDWAEDYYAHIISRAPRSGFAYWGRADAYAKHGQVERALADYARAIELLPKEAGARLRHGKALLAANRTEEAQQAFQAALSLAPYQHGQRQAREALEKTKTA